MAPASRRGTATLAALKRSWYAAESQPSQGLELPAYAEQQLHTL